MEIRKWIEVLRANDLLQEIDVEVDWRLEAGAVALMNQRVAHKAVLFNKVKDYPEWRLLGSTFCLYPYRHTWSMFNLLMGLPIDTPYRETRTEFLRRFTNPLMPIEIAGADAPCKEVIKVGKEANLLDIPFLYTHMQDGGRYSTLHQIINKDPDTDWTNYGMYRFMVHGPRRAGWWAFMGQHGPTIFYLKYDLRGKNCPFCLCMGGDLSLMVASMVSVPAGVCEADVAGGFNQAPLEVVRAETNDLLVAATSEVVIEGEILAGKRSDEGPFAEITGFVSGRSKQPVCRIDCITHRKNPILTFAQTGGSAHEGTQLAPAVSYQTYHMLTKLFQLPVADVGYFSDYWESIAMADTSPQAKSLVANTVFVHGIPLLTRNFVVLTDPDTYMDHGSTVLAELINCDPENDLHVTDMDVTAIPVTFHVTHKERIRGLNMASMWLDCTTSEKPQELVPRKDSFEYAFPQDLRQQVAAKWSRLGFDKPFDERR